jgi:hypothetical protein
MIPARKDICLFLLTLMSLFSSAAVAGEPFTVTIPAGHEVTMGDASAVLPLTVTNNSTNKDIRQITFNIDTAKYNFLSATSPPDGWCIETVLAGSITFALVQTSSACSNGQTLSQIDPGESITFNITVLPLADTADVTTDTLTSVTVQSQGGFDPIDPSTGGLPIWTRRALSLNMTVTPLSLGVGGEITLLMEITNRSNDSQPKSVIGSVPDPPGFIDNPATGLVQKIEGPFFGSTLLPGAIDGITTTITVGSTAGFPVTGSIKIGDEEVFYTGKIATAFTGAVRGFNGTTPSSHADSSLVLGLTPFSLNSGESGTITYKYVALGSGSVFFTARASDGAATSTSVSVDSDTVVIGEFTIGITIRPVTVISGQSVVATMSATNNGSTALVDVEPFNFTGCPGGASEGLLIGPIPSTVTSLAPGTAVNFQWTFQITGNTGDIYCFTGSARASGPVVAVPSPATSDPGSISEYSVTVSPSSVASGSTDQTLTWNINNNSGCTIRGFTVDPPTSGSDWLCSSTTQPAGWVGPACPVDPVGFSSSKKADDIPVGGTGSFSITFSTTETVQTQKEIVFPLSVLPRGCGNQPTTIGSIITISPYGLSLAHSPAGPIYADGSSRYTMTATLVLNGAPVSGKTISFSATNGTLTATSGITDSSGQASVDLISPTSTTDTPATVTVSYFGVTAEDIVNFTGFTGPNLQYVTGLTPNSVDCGQTTSFTMDVRNTGTALMNLTSDSYFFFTDGTTTLTAYLAATP